MKYILIFVLGFILNSVSGQSLTYFDLGAANEMLISAPIFKNQLDNTTKNLKNIGEEQTLFAAEMALINNMHSKLQEGLSQVSGTLKNGLTAKQIAELSVSVVNEIAKAAQIAKDHPEFLIFTRESVSFFNQRVVLIGTEVADIFKEDPKHFLDPGHRQKALTRILIQLRILHAMAHGITMSLESAIRMGFWRSLNPYAGWVNKDVRIIKDVIRNASLIH
ncbi:MAG TPA: hypothetical protein VKZ57_02820 [Sphingobacterium sp.]|nr:hypothetical protein [Sphingobacterium sp.]